MFKALTDDAYAICAARPLSDKQVALLGRLFRQPIQPSSSALEGRCSVRFAHLDQIGNVAVKYYTRGGIIRYFVKKRYIRWGPTRSQREFELFQKVRNLGISAPEPIAYAHQGRLFYQAWLVTRAVEGHKTLAQLCLTDEIGAGRLMTTVCVQINKLIVHGILHVDLHPGNILVNPEGRVYFIDFDKARLYKSSRGLKEKYLRRWQRAVVKHDLPASLYHRLAEEFEKIIEPTEPRKPDHVP
ncbi:hypothetical protein DSCO28_11540 [Desulfosarcina ovata subsp. sediminis]|uniref:Protein kinase domain-containing protein n=1 Tax=Desulfosarcina ovata subsp. sediminis TaxID=885957 RepID=A0A5K7ZEL3_9BACT|nr:lipopolysaccharide kinase InaA family protein [Desulfosarcina ovata]BBO80588.1 hypothetical protein DSCO28_11540 [Desulfosarcina ovata subsp. sediminis]